MADLSEKVGANVQEVARGIGLDNRIGTKFLHAGPGFGGSCFPKDTRALVKIALDHDVHLRIVEAVLAVNDNRKRAMARKVSSAVGGSLRGKTVAVLGLTFKPDTDDMREAPSIPLVTGLLDMGAKVRAHDPVGMEAARRELPDIEYCDDPYLCARGADALVVVTEWAQYRGARSRTSQERTRPSRRGRPAQCLSARGHGGARLYLRKRRPAGRAGLSLLSYPAPAGYPVSSIFVISEVVCSITRFRGG